MGSAQCVAERPAQGCSSGCPETPWGVALLLVPWMGSHRPYWHGRDKPCQNPNSHSDDKAGVPRSWESFSLIFWKLDLKATRRNMWHTSHW